MKVFCPGIAAVLFGWLLPMFGQAPTSHQFVNPIQLKVNGTSAYPASSFDGLLGVGDFNTDGRRDILGYYTPGQIPAQGNPLPLPKEYAVLLAQADGSYTPKLTGIPVAFDPGLQQGSDTVRVADVNGDGRPDLVIVTSAPGDNPSGLMHPAGNSMLNVYLGKGDGTFQAIGPVVAGANLFAHLDVVVDLNRDNQPDLIIATNAKEEFGFAPFPATHTAWINDGSGRFTQGKVIGDGYYLAARDFSSDGYTDVVLTGKVLTGNKGIGIQVYLNERGTGFTAGAVYSIDADIAAVGDMNRDGKLDLVTLQNRAQGSQNNPGHILLGNGDGTFRSGGNFSSVYGARAMTVTDVNADGEPDISLVNSTPFETPFEGNTLQVYTGKGDGTVGSPHDLQRGLIWPSCAAITALITGKPCWCNGETARRIS